MTVPVIRQLEDTAVGLVLEIGEAPANSWAEFHCKLAVLLDDYNTATVFMDVIRDDVCRLVLSAPELQLAAE